MADGARAITLAKHQVSNNTSVNENDLDEERLMCWPHVFRAISKKLSNSVSKDVAKDLIEDISVIQLSQNRNEFDKANELFLLKWLNAGDAKIDTFVAYYNLQWVQSAESNWFVGAGPIDHNNGIEGTNDDIKKRKTIRDKQPLGAFLQNALDIVEGWSKKDDSRLYCRKANLISLKHQTDGFQWLMQNQKSSSILKYRGNFYVLGSKALPNLDIKDALKVFIEKKVTLAYDDGFDEWKRMKSSVYELIDDGEFFKCNCPAGMKKYFCKHYIGLSVKFKNYKIPDTAKSVPLAQKRTRGRPAKNKGWWSHQ